MKIEVKNNQLILKEVYNSITIETAKGNQLHICLRDNGFEMKLNTLGQWHLISEEKDWKITDKPYQYHIAYICKNAGEFRAFAEKMILNHPSMSHRFSKGNVTYIRILTPEDLRGHRFDASTLSQGGIYNLQFDEICRRLKMCLKSMDKR